MGVTEGDLYGVAGVFEESVETESGRDGAPVAAKDVGGRPLWGGRRQVKTSLIIGARVML